MNNLVGQQWGNYRLTRLLGQGGFAEVYLAEHTRLKMFAAIKILYTHLSQEGIETFQNEAQVIANLVHPHIVRLLDFDVKDGRPFLILDYASNGSLRQRHPKGTRLPLDQVVNYTRQVADALQFAHDKKLIHRDVKPENILLGQQDALLLSDFGIASIAHSTSSMNVQSSMGTIPYMAPEQIQGYPRPASDQYALGIVVYQWLSGDVPFQGNSSEIIAQHLGVEVPPVRKHIPDIPADVDLVLAMALAKDPKARFGSVQAFATALEQASKPVSSQRLYATRPAPAQPAANLIAPTVAASPLALPQENTPPAFAAPTVADHPFAVPQAHTPQVYAQSQTQAAALAPYPEFSPYSHAQLLPLQATQRSGKVAFKWGGIFGAGLIVFELMQFLLLQSLFITLAAELHLSLVTISLWNNVLHYLVFSVIYFCLGIVAGSKAGKVAASVLASLWANLWVYLVIIVLDVIAYVRIYEQIYSRYPAAINNYMRTLITSYMIGLLIALALGAGLSALGGLIGRSLAKKR